jgi:galactose mutarotase-like enzyme
MTVIQLATEGVSLTMLPERGGKIVSLFDKRHGREWLEQPNGEGLRVPAGAASFDLGDMCGWDEIMPTVASCRLNGSVIELPDHGDLWQTSWDVLELGESTVTTRARGLSLDYVLERTLTLRADGLRVHYSVSTGSQVPQALLWAAHPLFSMHAGTRVVLDDAVTNAAEVAASGVRHVVAWPREGVNVQEDLPVGTGRKLFVKASPTSEASLVDRSGTFLTLQWSTNEAPYLGIWLDHCSLSRLPVVSLEPTTGNDDALDVAMRLGPLWEVSNDRPRRWSINVRLGHGETSNRE